MKIRVSILRCFLIFGTLSAFGGQNNPSTNAIPGSMEALRISTNIVVITNRQNATASQSFYPEAQGTHANALTNGNLYVVLQLAISNGTPWQTVVMGIKPSSTNTVISNVGSVVEQIQPQVQSYNAFITSVVWWPQSPYYTELDFETSQADTFTFFSTNLISTNPPFVGTGTVIFTNTISVTSNSVTIVSQ